jgi:hypothetical protein
MLAVAPDLYACCIVDRPYLGGSEHDAILDAYEAKRWPIGREPAVSGGKGWPRHGFAMDWLRHEARVLSEPLLMCVPATLIAGVVYLVDGNKPVRLTSPDGRAIF